MLLPVAAMKEAVEVVQQQIHQQRKIIDRCKGENHALREELTLRTKVLVQCTPELFGFCSKKFSCSCACSVNPMYPVHMSRTSWHSSQTSSMCSLAKYALQHSVYSARKPLARQPLR